MKKGYKVTDVKREKKIGVAAGSVEELIEKSCRKLCWGAVYPECRLFVAEDGTLVDDDDYLKTLPQQTLFVLLRNNEKMITDFDFYYESIRTVEREYIETGEAAQRFLSDRSDKARVLQRYVAAASEATTMLSQRTQDPHWFEGLEPSEKTKEQSMTKRVKDRMRGYYYKTKTALQSSHLYVHSRNGRGKQLIDQFLLDLRKLLETNRYNETYFNRKAEKSGRLCDERGLFECGGLWSADKCTFGSEHTINPYRSRAERIIFQTWNLDHKIELSRSIIPNILEAINKLHKGSITCIACNKDTLQGVVETDRYYLQIFTRNNLKLVHIVCHHKGKHEAASDVYTVCHKCIVKGARAAGDNKIEYNIN